LFAVAFVAIWEGVELLPTLWNGFVLAAVPALLARIAAVLCLGCGAALLLLALRLSDHAEPEPSDDSELSDEYEGEDASAWESYA
jgi:hypothetical protein